jgi:hypothetical protein
MYKKALCLVSLAAAVLPLGASPFASTVVNYNPGIGFAPGFTNVSAVIGQPSTSSAKGGAVSPFAPPSQTNQILSIGAGGSLTVGFDAPIIHSAISSRDFIVFGNSFFTVTNFSATNQPLMTSGAVYSSGGQSQVSVSADGVVFYRLNPLLAPQVNNFYPSDGAGNFQTPVDPALGATNFAGLTLAEVRALYNGSGGGASYSIGWAQDTNGNPVWLPQIRYVRVDVLSGRLQVSGFAAVGGTVIFEDFSGSPFADGWGIFGKTNLFAWDATNQNLRVTWDSAQPNSYFHHALGTMLDRSDDFSMSFDLLLTDYAIGVNTNLPTTFQLAAGFQNFGEAATPGFLRGGYPTQPDLVEFDFFPSDEFGATNSVWPTFVDSQNDFFYPGANAYSVMALPTNVFMRVNLNYASSNDTVALHVLTNGVAVGPVCTFSLGTNSSFGDFLVNTFSIENYNDAGQDPSYGGSLLAHGIIDNILLIVPPPPASGLAIGPSGSAWQAQFQSRTNWTYTLQRSDDLKNWTSGPPVGGNGGTLTLQDTSAPAHYQFYRVNATHD